MKLTPGPTLVPAYWKKQKAVTLMGETVSPALAKVATLTKEVVDKDERADPHLLATLSGALRTLQAEVKKTRAKCKRGLHDSTAKYLDQMANEAEAMFRAVQKLLVDWNAFLKDYDNRLAQSRRALQAVADKPLPETIEKAKRLLTDVNAWLARREERISVLEPEYAIRWHAVSQAADLVGDMQKRQPAGVGRQLPAAPPELQGALREINDLIAKLK